MKKLTISIFIIICIFLSGCDGENNAYLKINNINFDDGFCYEFNLKNVRSMKLTLDVYEAGEQVNSIPLGTVNYSKETDDYGNIVLKYNTSNNGYKIIQLKLNSQIFNDYGDTKIFDSQIDLSDCIPHVLVKTVETYKSEIINMIDFKKTSHSNNEDLLENGYRIVLETVLK